MRPSQANLALEELRKSFSAPLRRKGIELSFDDSQTVLDIYQQWLLLMVDLGYLHPDELLRTARRLLTDMVRVDVLDLNNAFAECLQSARMQSNRGFKGLCSRISSHLYPLIKDDIELMSTGDVYSAGRLMQAFAYTSRLTLKDIDLTQQMLEAYCEVEEKIPATFSKPLIQSLNKIIRRWMEPFDPDGIVPRHGDHGVAGLGRASMEAKYKDLTSDRMLEYAFGSPWWVSSPIRSSMDRISHTIFVPKSYKTFRTISMEPTTLMYFQQGIRRELDRLVLRNRYLRSRIDTHDQNRNRLLAKQGSIGRDFATIDLSSASDSVSYELVKELFRGTKVLRFIVATRSRRTLLPDGRLFDLKKFAPMGSALCFPIETIIFASVCEYVTRECRDTVRYSVYGDDIIVPTQCAEYTMRILESLGFHVNRDKSFFQSTCWFRESCGGEYCDGFDVTPMRVSRRYAHRERDVRLAALIDSANRAYLKGYRNLRGFFIQRMRSLGFKPLFSPTALLSDNYTNYHVAKRWNRNLQKIEVHVSDMDFRYLQKDIDSQDESIRYRHWFEATQLRFRADDGFKSVVCQPTAFLRDAWREKPYELPDQEFIDSRLRQSLLLSSD